MESTYDTISEEDFYHSLSDLHAGFKTNWAIIQKQIKSAAKKKTNKERDAVLSDIFKICEKVSLALPWDRILTLEQKIKMLPDNILDGNNVASDMLKKIENPEALLQQISVNFQAGMKYFDEATFRIHNFDMIIRIKLHAVLMVAQEVEKIVAVFVKQFRQLKADASSGNPTFLNDGTILDLNGTEVDTSPSKKESEPMINDILDKFTRGEITKEQMNAQLSEFAKKDVYRTITSINKLPF